MGDEVLKRFRTGRNVYILCFLLCNRLKEGDALSPLLFNVTPDCVFVKGWK
jgi:hypothetical protein